MKYVVKKIEQGFPFYIKAVDVKQRSLSVEVDPAEARQFNTREEATAFLDDNELDHSFTIEELADAPAESGKASAIPIAEADPKYLPWLHELTILGYDQDVVIETEHAEAIAWLFVDGKTPEQALEEYAELKGRLEALKSDLD